MFLCIFEESVVICVAIRKWFNLKRKLSVRNHRFRVLCFENPFLVVPAVKQKNAKQDI